jgi:hypothetical protein
LTSASPDPFIEMVAELADGHRWTLLRGDGWEEFITRLTGMIVDFPARRRQALLMLLFALAYEQLTPDVARAWLDHHEVDSDDGVDAMITWLRQFRPPEAPPMAV